MLNVVLTEHPIKQFVHVHEIGWVTHLSRAVLQLWMIFAIQILAERMLNVHQDMTISDVIDQCAHVFLAMLAMH